ncbi:glycogen/starch/alpha-glucan phosphorylase [Caballeronia sp. GAFFF1]|uniref:glycogen/starch/alpha-glucan phosphorylase n=1 Tax=Caballeronia sp. GAFFF1 TaxID=2921779 RepID=UPI0032F040F0
MLVDSLSSLQIPAIGCVICYEFAIFNQGIRDGWQVERADKWLEKGNPLEILRPDVSFRVYIGGYTRHHTNADGRFAVQWIRERQVKEAARDMPIQGFRVNTCNVLRLWKSEAVESFDFQGFNSV